MNKPKVIFNRPAQSDLFNLGTEILEGSDEHNYLGQVVSADPSHAKEIRHICVMMILSVIKNNYYF